jgi:ABC-type multidrug transport system permease subunit
MALAITVLLGAGLVVGWRQHTGPVYLVAGLALLLAFASAMVWLGTWIGLMVRTPDAVMGVAFVVVFPLTFVSNAFVPIESMPPVLQWFAAWNPVSAMVAAVRELFGNPTAPLTQPSWPLQNPVLASVIYCALLLAIFIPLALRRYKARTSD